MHAGLWKVFSVEHQQGTGRVLLNRTDRRIRRMADKTLKVWHAILMDAVACRLSFVERNRRAARGEPIDEEEEEDAIQDPEAATQSDSGAPGLSLRLELPADDIPGSSRWAQMYLQN